MTTAAPGVLAPPPDAPSGDDGVSLEELRRALVRGGTRRELARKLGLSERTLYRRLAMAKSGGDT